VLLFQTAGEVYGGYAMRKPIRFGTLSRHGIRRYDEDKVDEMVLALLFLTAFEESPHGARAWKGHDWNVLDRLHAKGYISDPRSKAKSVVVTEEGIRQSRALFAKYFGKK